MNVLGLQKILGELWEVCKTGMYRGQWKSQTNHTSTALQLVKKEDVISSDDYVVNMCENQNAICYLATYNLKSAYTASFLEKLSQKGPA